MLDKLKQRWGVDNFWQVLLILFIFSISGMSVLYVRKLAFHLLGFDTQTPLWAEIIAWLFIVVPSYQLLFLLYGTILGQFNFVWRFEKKNLRRLKGAFEKLNSLL